MKNKIKRIYCDTSVIGGLFDVEFSHHSRRFIDYVQAGIFNLVLSPVVANEILDNNTPVAVVKEYNNL